MSAPEAPNWFERRVAVLARVSLRAKIMGMALGLVVLLGLAATLEGRDLLDRSLSARMRDQALSVTHDVAARATDPILVNNLYALHTLLQDTRASHADVRYAFIVGPQGQVLAHTFGEGFPEGLLAANTVAGDGHHRTVVLETDEGPVWDTAVPIFEGRAGVARVGLSTLGLRQTIAAATSQLVLTTLIVSSVGLSTAGLLTWLLTRPVLRLVAAARAVERGDYRQQVPKWADDEIGDLTDAFNAMTAALARGAEERREREHLRAQYVSGVIAAQEEERKRIARELHDSTSQALSSLLIGLRVLADRLDEPEARQRAEDLRAIVAQTLDEVHALAVQLRPSVLDDLGLPAALERHIADCRRRYPLAIDLAVSGLASDRLPATVETALYRIVQEALTNVVRHADATTASVLVERRDGAVRLVIEDDGRGFDAGAINRGDGHLGLYSIRERAELLGGTLTIESAPGQGASLFVELPLRPIPSPEASATDPVVALGQAAPLSAGHSDQAGDGSATPV
jgi:signal transduction histidine kinase